MARISITLPNNTLITLEWDEQESVHDVLAQVLHGLQLGSHPVPQSDAIPGHESDESAEKSSATPETREFYTAESPWEQTNGVAPGHSSNGIGHTSNGVAGYGEALPMASYADLGDDSLDLGRYTQEALEDFTAFCRSINPTGDMRRVVVAAEAANRFFGLEGVTADELGELFDLAGWRRANSFTQTIRNAARAKFRWLERIPGRSGRYSATDFGRATTLSR